MNISSVVVIPQPQRAPDVAALLGRLPGVEVAVVSPEGRIVATIETDGDAETVRSYEAIAALEHVMSVAMVYHHREDEPAAPVAIAV